MSWTVAASQFLRRPRIAKLAIPATFLFHLLEIGLNWAASGLLLSGVMTRSELEERSMAFAVATAALCEELRQRPIAWNTAAQLLDAATSMAANYRATSRSRSRAEWNAKIGVVAEEADESVHWLEFVLASKLATEKRIGPLLAEAKELRAIFAASAATSRRNTKRRPHKDEGEQ